jgi:tetratricopeptide (TPR) repeat protein
VAAHLERNFARRFHQLCLTGCGGGPKEICEALRAAGIEVFLDQSELRGGDAWDQKIRREIHDCALFIPVISANTALRHEGYFRLEWDLADQRTHMIARSRVFVVPVCLDATTEVAADVPESFQRVQWTHLPRGQTFWGNRVCLAIIYDKLGRHTDAEAILGKMKVDFGDPAAYQYAEIYAQWGNTSAALDWLEKAFRLHDDGLLGLKTDPLLDPLRKEPRFQAIERELKFPT